MNKTVELLGDKAEYLLSHTCKTIDKSTLHLPSPHTVEEVWAASDRNIPTLNSLQRLLGHGRLGGTGYVSILPVDQGITPPARRSPPIRSTSIPKISSGWRSKAAATA